jgi:hypothetical protein
VAARAYWKGYLKLSLVSCPIALFPATSEREKISFHQLNKETGNRIRYRKIDAETGDEVSQDNIIKGYELSKGEYIELDPEELEAVAIESKHTLGGHRRTKSPCRIWIHAAWPEEIGTTSPLEQTLHRAVATSCYFRFSPESRHSPTRSGCPPCAKSGHSEVRSHPR